MKCIESVRRVVLRVAAALAVVLSSLNPSLAAEASASSVALTLHGRGAPAQGRWPVTFGVPFAEGVLREADLGSLRLTGPDGRAVAIQTRITARWFDDSIQWLLIDAQAPLPEARSTYRLSWGGPDEDDGEASAAGAAQVTVQEQSGRLLVDTGVLRFAVPLDRLTPLAQVQVQDGEGQWVAVFPEGESAELYLEDGEGAAYRGSLETEPQVVVEEPGPQRVSIRLEGWLVSPDGAKLGRRIVRVQAFAGHRGVRMYDTWVNTADTQETTFANISLHLPFAGDRYRFHATDDEAGPVRDSAYLLQYDADRYDVVRDGQSRAGRGRSPGRVTVSQGATSYTASWRHFWQMHPNELEVTPGELRLHFWPRHGKPATYRNDPNAVRLDNIVPLQWVHEGEVLDLSTPEAVKHFDHPEYPRDYRFNVLTELAGKDNAFGVARTSEYWLDFHGESAADEALARIEAFEAHPLMLADPQWLADSQAFWNIAARSEHYEQVETGPEQMLDFLFDTMYERVDGYGKWIFGAYNNNYLPGFQQRAIHRPWQVFYHGGSRWPWLALARSGDPRFFTYAEMFGRHLMDVSVVHWEDKPFNARHWDTSQPFWRTGAKYRGGAASVVGLVPWFDGASTAFDTDVDYALWYFFLTGYQRAWDVAMLQGELLLREESLLRREQHFADADRFPEPDLFPTPEAAQAYQARFRGSVHDLLTPGRQGTAPGAAALHLYRVTHDERYFLMAKRIMDHYRRLEDQNPGSAYSQHYYAPFMVRYWDVTRDESLKPYILQWARDRMRNKDARTWDSRDQYYDQMALAYQLSGDPAFLEHGLAQTQVMQDNRFAGLDEEVNGVPYWTGLPSGIGYMGQTWGFLVRALDDHHQRTGERLLPPSPIEAYPFVSIVSSTRQGGRQQIIFHLRKAEGEAVELELRFNSRGDDPVTWQLDAPNGRQLASRQALPRPVERLAPAEAQGAIRIPLTAGMPAGDYRITLHSASRIDVHWPYPGPSTYSKLVVEAPVDMSPRMGPPLRAFMPRGDRLEVTVPQVYEKNYSTYRVYDAEGREVFAQTAAGRTNTPMQARLAVPPEQRGRPWFYRRAPSQTAASEPDLQIDGILPIWGFTKETFFVPERFSE